MSGPPPGYWQASDGNWYPPEQAPTPPPTRHLGRWVAIGGATLVVLVVIVAIANPKKKTPAAVTVVTSTTTTVRTATPTTVRTAPVTAAPTTKPAPTTTTTLPKPTTTTLPPTPTSHLGDKGVPSLAEFAAFDVCKHFVGLQLKSPGSAVWRNPAGNQVTFTDIKGKSPITVVATVDSQNSFGALLRSNYTCTVTNTGGDNWHLDNISVTPS